MQFISDPSTSLDVLGATFLLPARNNNITYHHQCGDWTGIIWGNSLCQKNQIIDHDLLLYHLHGDKSNVDSICVINTPKSA